MKYYYLLILISIINYCYCQNGVVISGEDWSIPITVNAASNSGFFSEEADPSNNINLPVFDVTWNQINPSKSVFSYSASQSNVQDGMDFTSFNSQNSTTKPFWMRIWTGATTWAPSWIQTECSVGSIGSDSGLSFLPVWNPCVWGYIKQMYTQIFKTGNMRADPRLKFIYVPGMFTWTEFDFTIIGQYANTNSSFTYTVFNTWFQQAMQDLVDIFGPYSYKLVYTGEDFPFDIPDNWYPSIALSAKDAVEKGMGIRTGITELFNFHLSEIPAYGITINSNGYMVLDKTWPLQKNPNRIIATENECYKACGYTVSDANLFYAIKMSNLKAIQMGVNWLYVVTTDSYLTQYADHWKWVSLNIGRLPSDAIEAWVSLREAQDTYWNDLGYPDFDLTWTGRPYVKNFERFLYQRDIQGSMTKRGSTQYSKILEAENGVSYEARSTDIATGNNSIALLVDDDYAYGTVNISLKITYLDNSASSFYVQYYSNTTLKSTQPVSVTSTNTTKTVTFAINNITFKNQFTNLVDFKIVNNGAADIEVFFVRIIKLSSVVVDPKNDSQNSSNNNNNIDNSSVSNSLSKYNNNYSLLFVILILISLIINN